MMQCKHRSELCMAGMVLFNYVSCLAQFKKLCSATRRRTFTVSACSLKLHKHPRMYEERFEQKKEIDLHIISDANTRTYVFGNARHGALGNPDFLKPPPGKNQILDKTYPQRLKFCDHFKMPFRHAACGNGFTLFLTNKPHAKFGQLLGCGNNSDSQLGHQHSPSSKPVSMIALHQPVDIKLPLTNRSTVVTRIAAGRAHSVVVTDLEGVFSFGNNGYGQCGRTVIPNEQYRSSTLIYKIRDLPGNIVDAVCGLDHTIFITSGGQVYACGWGADGQTGLQSYKTQAIPMQIRGDIEREKVVKVSCAGDCVLALNDRGELFGWGNSEYRQLGTATEEQQSSTPRKLKLSAHIGRVADIAAGGSHCLLINEYGQVFTWGCGVLGRGSENQICREPEEISLRLFGWTEVDSGTQAVRCAAGLLTSAVINSAGSLFTWGRNQYGELGLGHQKTQYYPMQAAISVPVLEVNFGIDHTICIARSTL